MASNVNAYASLSELKAILGISSTTDDVVMRKILEAASRTIENYTKRFFYVKSETRTFDGVSHPLFIDDLLSIDASGLKTDEDANGSYEITFATGDYILYPLNLYPKTWIDLTEDSDRSEFAGDVRNGVQIAGVWGYGDGTSATPYVTDTTLNGAIVAGDLTINVVSATNLSAGHTILIVDTTTSNEQCYITSISSNALTVERGVNGTSAVAHATGKQIYYYRYPRDVMQACLDLSVALYNLRGKRGLSSERLGDYSYSLSAVAASELTQSILSSIDGYRKMVL